MLTVKIDVDTSFCSALECVFVCVVLVCTLNGFGACVCVCVLVYEYVCVCV